MFTYHDKTTAPEESRPLIEESERTFGFLPKLHQILAEAPAAYALYNRAFDSFQSNTTLSPTEQQVVMMTANVENRCHYCTAGHSMLMQMSGMPEALIQALREDRPTDDPRIEALRDFVRGLIRERGHIGDDALHRFLDAGYSKRQALEVLVGLAAKLVSNFANALAHTELDAPVEAFAWSHPADRAA